MIILPIRLRGNKLFAVASMLAIGVVIFGRPHIAQTAELRQTISLDGKWSIAEGSLKKMPEQFDRTVPVPGLADMATPPFEQVGPVTKQGTPRPGDPRREVFWYQRTFTLPQELPSVVRLKIGKATFGTAVYVNGKEIGTHWPCFTPGLFDIRSAARPGENTLVVRIGASPAVLPEEYMSGFDVEKVRAIPGIFDSVELVLANAPFVENVQVAPQIDKRQARVQIELKSGAAASSQPIVVEVQEAKSGKTAGRVELTDVNMSPNEKRTIDTVVTIENCHLWSPEDPFLYNLIVRTAGDMYQTRFGMREFKFVLGERHARLNGKPYWLRGNNITLYRFFEDPERGSLPWDEAWVRKMFRLYGEKFRWNAYRFCIGFPPEFWYRIADEEGILVQDEFPAWGWITEKRDLVTEYTEWMRERWNHPSVVIWDAQNETPTDLTGKALQKVRGLDMSNRPWDNGWGEPQSPTDTWEAHPYLFMCGPFTLEKLGRTPATYCKSDSIGNPLAARVIKDPTLIEKFKTNPVILNEYEWLWVNRDGSPTTLTKGVYESLLGKDNTAEKRFYLQARYNAAVTEFWRSSRLNAGVLHFTALGYSRPDGQTSDFLRDIAKLEIEPNYLKYMPDAFAPVGVMLDFWQATAKPGESQKMHIVAINDLEPAWTGSVQFRILSGDRVLTDEKKPLTITSYGRAETSFDCRMPTEPGDYRLEAILETDGQKPTRSLRDVRIEAK